MGKIDGGLRSEFRKHLLQFDWCSIESGGTGGGIPDSNYCTRGTEGWIEYKWTDGWAVTLEPAQIGWIARRVRNGGRVHVAVRRRHGGGKRLGAAVDELHVFHGRHVVEARSQGLRGEWTKKGTPVLVWHGGPASWDWWMIAHTLTS